MKPNEIKVQQTNTMTDTHVATTWPEICAILLNKTLADANGITYTITPQGMSVKIPTKQTQMSDEERYNYLKDILHVTFTNYPKTPEEVEMKKLYYRLYHKKKRETYISPVQNQGNVITLTIQPSTQTTVNK